MNQRFKFFEYSKDNFLSIFGPHTRQTLYLERYIGELGAKTILREPKYFDRDYLAEFAAFYSVSSKGYPNICERFHFFAEKVGRRTLVAASGGSRYAQERLQNAYLGFIVKRPIPAVPLGRTVLKWYPDKSADTTPRVTASSRKNFAHIAGVRLYVEGLAWQQQDSGVGACATVSLWSMLQSSAFDAHHAIPSTAEITQAAHKRHSFGSRMFPSKGLNIIQVYEVINERDLVPLICEGDAQDPHGRAIGFSKARFASTCAAFIRSGHPVLIVGEFRASSGERGEHAICSVGFRSCIPSSGDPSAPDLAESNIEHLYVHDDNLGPNVRVKVDEEEIRIESGSMNRPASAKSVVSLRPEGPPPRHGNSQPSSPIDNSYGTFVPTQLIVAANTDIRTDPDTLHKAALRHVSNIGDVFNRLADVYGIEKRAFAVASRFFRISEYLGTEIGDRLGDSSRNAKKVLSAVRLQLAENVNPMSLHIAVVRVGLDDSTILADILYDTTDSDRNHPIFAYVAYYDFMVEVIQFLEIARGDSYGVCVRAY